MLDIMIMHDLHFFYTNQEYKVRHYADIFE